MTIYSHIKHFAVVAVLTTGFGLALPAAAIDLDQARTQGLIGERADGLVAAVAPSSAADVRALVDEIASVNSLASAEVQAGQKLRIPLR